MPHRSKAPPPGFAAEASSPHFDADAAAAPGPSRLGAARGGGGGGAGKPDLAALKQERAQQKQKSAEQKQLRSTSKTRAGNGKERKKGKQQTTATSAKPSPATSDVERDNSSDEEEGGEDSAAFSTTSDSSSGDGNSSDEEEAAALEMDGQELWAQNYCAICDRLIEPGTGVTASGAIIGLNAGSSGKEGGAQASELSKAIDALKRNSSASNSRTPSLRRTGSGSSANSTRMNALSDLNKGGTNKLDAPAARHHTRTPSGGSGTTKGRKSPAALSRANSLTRIKNGGLNKSKEAQDLLLLQQDGSEACSPVEERSGIATPPGTGSGIVRSQEEAKAARKKARERGSTLLGPLTPMMLKEQEELEKAKERTPMALYCSVECRQSDEARSKELSGLNPYLHNAAAATSPDQPIMLMSNTQGPSSAGLTTSFSMNPAQSSYMGGTSWTGAPYSAGGYPGPIPPWAQMPLGPSSSSSISWQNNNQHMLAMTTSRPNSAWGGRLSGGGGAGWAGGSHAGSYPYYHAYPNGVYGYPPPEGAALTPDIADCDCEECRAAVAAAAAASSNQGRSSSRGAGGAVTPAGKNKEPADNVSTVPSGASDTTESSGGYPYGPMAPGSRAKKRTQSGRVETPLNLHPSQAASGDYFGGTHRSAHHLQQHGQQQAQQSKQYAERGTGEQQKRFSLGTGSTSTNGTEDSTLSYWESKPRKRSQSPRRGSGAQQEDYDWPPRRDSVASQSLSASLNAIATNSPLRLLKHRGSGQPAPPSVDVDNAAAQGVGPSTSFNNASGFLSRSLASEHTELGTSATTTGTFNVQRSATIRGTRPSERGAPGDQEALAEEQTASPVVATSQAPAMAHGTRHGGGSFPSSASYRSEADSASLPSAIGSLRLAQARNSMSDFPSRMSLSSMWGSNTEDASPNPSLQRQDSRPWSIYSESSQSRTGTSMSSSTSGSGWWRSFVPAWASIKALQALSNSADSDDEEIRPQPVRSQGEQPPVRAAPDVVRPAARRAEVPAFANEIGQGEVPGETGEPTFSVSAAPPAEDEAEARRKKKAERERAHKHRRSKDAHMLPPLLAPSRSSTNLRLANPRSSRAGSQSYVRGNAPLPSPMFGSFGVVPRSTTPGPIGGYRSTTPSNMVPPSPGLRAVRSPARSSFGNLTALGDPMMRPPSRTGSAMGMHVGSLSASPRRAGLGWGPISQNPVYTDPTAFAYTAASRPGGPVVSHAHVTPHQHRHHHHHTAHHAHHHQQGSSQDLTGGRSASYTGEDSQVQVGERMTRPGSGMGYRVTAQRPRSIYGSSFGQDSMQPTMSNTQLSQGLNHEPARTWSYERMPGVKTYSVMQLPNRKPAHDVYDAGWSEVLATKPLAEDLQEDPAEEAKAENPDVTPAATIRASESSRKRLFFFPGEQPG